MQTAVACVLLIAGACIPASARALGGDPFAREMYHQWEHAAVRTSRASRSLMTSGPTASPWCPPSQLKLYKDSMCQAEGGKNATVVISPGSCVNVDNINKDFGIHAYKYSAPPNPKSIQFFTTTDCSGPFSVGLEGITSLQTTCPAAKSSQPVDGWNFGSFQPDEPKLTNYMDFDRSIKSIYYYCPSASTA